MYIYALVEFSHAALCNADIVPAVDLGNLVALDVLVGFPIHGQEPSKGDSEVVPETGGKGLEAEVKRDDTYRARRPGPASRR